MNTGIKTTIMALLAGGLAGGVIIWAFGPKQSTDAGTGTVTTVRNAKASGAASDLELRIAAMETKLAEIQTTLKAGGSDPERIATIEQTVKTLQHSMEDVSLEKASAERQALFAAEEGYLKADEYFEAGKYAIAGEGYLTFLQHHPKHADAREVMKKARDAFLKAGYKDKAFWVQEEMMKAFPQHQYADLWEQATLEKDAGLYDRAVEHAAKAAEMAPNPEERLWKRLYWAWYVQLRDGTPAGITALQQVQGEIATSGVSNPRLAENAAQRMAEWQKLAGSGGNK